MISISRYIPSLCLTLLLASCASKTAVVEESPVVKKETPAVAAETIPELSPEMDLPAGPDDEIRVPGMNLPTENDFRASNPQQGGGTSGVYVRPSTDPPSRVKPTE